MIEYKIYAYVAVGLLALYLAIRLAGQHTIKKLIRAEYEHVLHGEEHKVKGKFE